MNSIEGQQDLRVSLTKHGSLFNDIRLVTKDPRKLSNEKNTHLLSTNHISFYSQSLNTC